MCLGTHTEGIKGFYALLQGRLLAKGVFVQAMIRKPIHGVE